MNPQLVNLFSLICFLLSTIIIVKYYRLTNKHKNLSKEKKYMLDTNSELILNSDTIVVIGISQKDKYIKITETAKGQFPFIIAEILVTSPELCKEVVTHMDYIKEERKKQASTNNE